MAKDEKYVQKQEIDFGTLAPYDPDLALQASS